MIKNINLDHEDGDQWPKDNIEVKLSDAIRHSLKTEGCLLYGKLKEKQFQNQFGNPAESYLRITMGCKMGKSPGHPYVLEIWPSGHSSPIHNHGNASAVIKVIHGTVNVNIFNKHINAMTVNSKPLKSFDLSEGQISWMSKDWFQTHQLRNLSTDYCATIHAYQFEDSDGDHWPFFDYVSSKNVVEEFLPNTDITFIKMRDIVLEEYKKHLKKNFQFFQNFCPIRCKLW